MLARQGKMLKETLAASGDLRTADYGVTYAITERGGRFVAAVWVPRKTKPMFYTIVRSEERGMELVDHAVEVAKSAVDAKAEGKRRAAEMRAAVKVGSIFSYSWGYEQTNVDFFEVVDHSATKATVTVRKIAAETVAETGWASAKIKPVPGRYVGSPIKKRVTEYGINFSFGSGKIVNEGDMFHCSWYH